MVTARAQAGNLLCPPADEGTITLDGLGDDWTDAPAMESGDDNAGIKLRCDTQGKQLILEIEGRDQRVIRTKQARPGEDHIDLKLDNRSYRVFPAASGLPAKIVPGGAHVVGTSNDKGFIIEVAWPLSAVKHGDRVQFSATFQDCDSAALLKTERSVYLTGQLAFSAGDSALDAFLGDKGLTRANVRWQKSVRAGGKSVQLVLAGKLIGAIGDGYGYIELPVSDGKDVAKPQLVDLAGDGRQVLLLEYVERGDGGERTVLAAYRASGNQLTKLFAAEIGKRTPDGSLTSKYSLHRRGRATDLVLEAMPANGLDATKYQEAAADDVVPILLPWSTEKKATFSFSGDSYTKR